MDLLLQQEVAEAGLRLQAQSHAQIFEIFTHGEPRSQTYYPSFEQASLEWDQNPTGRLVVRVNASGQVLQYYAAQECREALVLLSFQQANSIAQERPTTPTEATPTT